MNDDYSGPLRIRYIYKQDDPLPLRYAHGVWGGINSQGEIELNFYTESDALPDYSERQVDPDGNMGPEKAPHEERQKNIIRHIHTKLVLNYHTARAVQEWLDNHLNLLEENDELDLDAPSGSSGSFEQ